MYTTNFSIKVNYDSKYSNKINSIKMESDTKELLKVISELNIYSSIKETLMETIYKENYYRFIDSIIGGAKIKNMKIDDYNEYVIINYGLFGTHEHHSDLIKKLKKDKNIDLLFVGCELGGIIYNNYSNIK